MEIRESIVYRIIAKINGQTLYLTANNKIGLEPVKESVLQGWVFKKSGDNSYHIYPYSVDNVLLTSPLGIIQVTLAAQNSATTQIWEFQETGDGYYNLLVQKNSFNRNKLVYANQEVITQYYEDYWEGKDQWKLEEMNVSLYEKYDTSDAEVRKMLLERVDAFKIKSVIKSSVGTKEKPSSLKAGFILFDFNGKEGGDINIDFKKLVGKNDELVNFVSKESKGKVSLNIELYKENINPTWVRLPKNYSDYNSNKNLIIEDLKAKLVIPETWDFIFLGFTSNIADSILQSNMAVFDINGKQKPVVFLDTKIYSDSRPECVTIHEFGHALCLRDLYSDRSFGWSLMSSAGSGWHFTALEHLLLGWEDIENFVFLKSGTINTDLYKISEQEGTKAIIIMPEHNNSKEDWYIIEVAQETGNGIENMKAFDNYGLLVMIGSPTRQNGVLNPFVSKGYIDKSIIEKYWYAPNAPFKEGEKFTTNGIIGKVKKGYDKNNKKLNVEVILSKTISDRATILRENEVISNGTDKFYMDVRGRLWLNDKLIIHKEKFTGRIQTPNYGYTAFVNKEGIFCIANVGSDKETPGELLTKFDSTNGNKIIDEKFYFKIENNNGKAVINAYQDKVGNGSDILKFTIFEETKANVYTSGWEIKKDGFRVYLQADGNLMWLKDDVYKWGVQSSDLLGKMSIQMIVLDDNGKMIWVNDEGNIAKEFKGVGGTAPFYLDLNISDINTASLEVKDKDNVSKYLVKLDDSLEVKLK